MLGDNVAMVAKHVLLKANKNICEVIYKKYRIFIGSAFCRENNLISENDGAFVTLKSVLSYSKMLDNNTEYLPDNYVDCECEVKEYFYADGALLYKNNFSRNGSVKS